VFAIINGCGYFFVVVGSGRCLRVSKTGARGNDAIAGCVRKEAAPLRDLIARIAQRDVPLQVACQSWSGKARDLLPSLAEVMFGAGIVNQPSDWARVSCRHATMIS